MSKLSKEIIEVMKKAIMIDDNDNVATAIAAIRIGDEVEIISSKQEVIHRIKAKESLPLGHKIALYDIQKGDEVKKYGTAIGKASKNITSGEYVHIHNVKSSRLPLTEHMLSYK